MFVKNLLKAEDPSFILFFFWNFKLIIRKDEFRMTQFLGESYEEDRNGGLLSKILTLYFSMANRRFCLPLHDLKENVIPNPFSRHCLLLLKDMK